VTVGAAEAIGSAALTCSLPIDPSDSFGRDARWRDLEGWEPPVFARQRDVAFLMQPRGPHGSLRRESEGVSFLKGVRE